MRDWKWLEDRRRPETGRGGTAPGDEPRPPPDVLELRSTDGRLVVPVAPVAVTIGRAAENAVVLHDRGVSAHHCLVETHEGRAVIVDRGSRNGTFVNGVRVALGELVPGAEVLIGRSRFLAVPAGEAARRALVVGEDPALLRALARAARVAPSRAAVLVRGESGTGKELVAREIHAASGRPGALVTVNCGAITRELAESELFGHERGAFTGAVARRRGAFEDAQGGTLFLDEVGELPRALQPKLLRAIESGEVRPVGAARELVVDVRVVSATNRDLEAEVARGRFRLDLYHRLAHVVIELPPLRARKGDLPLLCRHFLDELAAAHGPRRLSEATLGELGRYDWPGNVRELRAAILRAMLLEDDELSAADLLPGQARREPTPPPGADAPGLIDIRGMTYAEIEEVVLRQSVALAGGNRSVAAQALGLAKSTLADRLKKVGI